MYTQILIYHVEWGVSAGFILYKTLEMQLLDEGKITLKEDWSEELYLMIASVV
jgi:hypothetical protein